MTNTPESSGWITVCDEEMVGAHLGTAEPTDSYEVAKRKLNELINWHIAVATDPAVNGGYTLKPEPKTLTDDFLISLWKTACMTEYSSRDLVLSFARSVEQAHGIGTSND